MGSEHDADGPTNLFKAIVFAPLIVVGLLILLLFWLTILDASSWLSNKFRECRARRGTDDTPAQNMESGMIESRAVESQAVENGMIEYSQMSRQAANTRQGPRRSGGTGSNTEELLLPPNALTEERVWWKLELQSPVNLH